MISLSETIHLISDSIPEQNKGMGFWDRVQDHTTTEFAFWISIGLLILASILKYVVSHKDTSKDWGHLIIEIPVDLCLVVLTILVTIYLKDNLGGGIGFIVITLLAIVVCCITRRKSMDYSEYSDKFGTSLFYGIVTVIISVGLCTWVYKTII